MRRSVLNLDHHLIQHKGLINCNSKESKIKTLIMPTPSSLVSPTFPKEAHQAYLAAN